MPLSRLCPENCSGRNFFDSSPQSCTVKNLPLSLLSDHWPPSFFSLSRQDRFDYLDQGLHGALQDAEHAITDGRCGHELHLSVAEPAAHGYKYGNEGILEDIVHHGDLADDLVYGRKGGYQHRHADREILQIDHTLADDVQRGKEQSR